jgi:GR25 family glycosyltransferase involved in LPS biosynthesis
MISKIYYINLDRRPDRDENVKKELSKLNFNGPVERIPAVDGRELDIPNLSDNLITKEGKADALNKNAGLYYVMTPGAIGCALSHHNLATKIIEEMSDDQYVLILEDDVELEDDFMNKLNTYIKEIPPFDVLLLGYHMKQNKMNGNDYYDQPLKSWGTFGFITNKKGSRELIKLFPIKHQVDTEMHKLYNNDDLKVYSLKEDKRLVKSPQSQEESQYGTDIQLREYPHIESFENIKNKKNNNDTYLLGILFIILLFLFYLNQPKLFNF